MNFYSIQQEIELGRTGADRMAQETTILRDPKVSQYLSVLGQELAAAADQIQFPYSFAVFRGALPSRLPEFPVDPEAFNEAIALAGGPVFVPARLVEKLDSEPELAAMLAHAIAHIALRHSTRMATIGELVNQASAGLPPGLGTPPLAFTSFARRFEKDADALAVHILAEAGYDPAGFISYLRKLPTPHPQIFAPHQTPEVRIQAVEAFIASLPAKTYRADSDRFAEWKAAGAAAGATLVP